MAYQSEIEKLEARFREKPEQWFAALADAYRKAGDVDMALEVLGAWIDRRPTYTSGHIVRGRCLLDRERYPEAAEAFEHVLGLDVENVIALKSLAEIAERAGDGATTRKWLRRLLDVDPMNKDAQEALDRLGAESPAPAQSAPVAGSPEAIAAREFSFLDMGSEPEPAALTIERTEEAFDLSAIPSSGGERLEGLETSEPLEGLDATGATEGLEALDLTEPAEAVDATEGLEASEAAEPAGAVEPAEGLQSTEPAGSVEGLESPEVMGLAIEMVVPERSEPAESAVPQAEPVDASVPAPPARKRADGPSPSLDLATPASDWMIPEPPPPAPRPKAAEPKAPGVEPAEFAVPEAFEPVPIEDLAPSAFEAAFDEFAAQAGPLETAAEFEIEAAEELEVVQPPQEPQPTRLRRTTADDVEFVQPPRVERPAEHAAQPPAPTPPEPDAELPLILPEEVSAELDEPSIREPEPVVTETMAALYASQGLFADAREIYVKLLARDPGNARLEGLLADIDEQAKAQAPATRRERYAAGAGGGRSVGDLMRELAGPVPESAPQAPARPAAEPRAQPPASAAGFSFDEFFSEGEPAEQEAEAEGGGPEDEDFQDWLDGLKS